MSPFDAIDAALARFPGTRLDDGYYGILWGGGIPSRRLDYAAFAAEYDARLRALPAVVVFAQYMVYAHSIDLAACVPAGTHVPTRRVLYSTDPQSPFEEMTQAAAIVAGDALDVKALGRIHARVIVVFHPDQAIALALMAGESMLFGVS